MLQLSAHVNMETDKSIVENQIALLCECELTVSSPRLTI